MLVANDPHSRVIVGTVPLVIAACLSLSLGAGCSSPINIDTGDIVARLADAGQVRPEIAAVFPLRDAAKAHQMSETEHVRGKIVLQVV